MYLTTSICKKHGKEWVNSKNRYCHLRSSPNPHIGNIDGFKVFKYSGWNDDAIDALYIMNSRGWVTNYLGMYNDEKNHLGIGESCATGTGPKQYKLYRFAMQYAKKALMSSTEHSIGSYFVWKKLAHCRNINVFGWRNNKPVNIDPLLRDIDEIYSDEEHYYDRTPCLDHIRDMTLVAHII